MYVVILGLVIGCNGGPSASPSPTASLPPPPVGYSATCVGQSANLDLARGQTGTFQVFCTNTGTTAWTAGTATEASLAGCCPAGANATFLTWGIPPLPSPSTPCNRYAVQSQSSVPPGAIGSFAFSVTVPVGTAAGTYTSDAVLVKAGCAPISTQVLTFTIRVP